MSVKQTTNYINEYLPSDLSSLVISYFGDNEYQMVMCGLYETAMYISQRDAEILFPAVCYTSHWHMFELLIRRATSDTSPRIFVLDTTYERGLTQAIRWNAVDGGSPLRENMAIIRWLIPHVCDFTEAMTMACACGRLDVLDLLIPKRGKTLLTHDRFEVACANGHINIIKRMIDVTIAKRNIDIPMWLLLGGVEQAIKRGQYHVVDHIMSLLPPDSKLVADNGVDVAIHAGNVQMVEYMLEMGAIIKYDELDEVWARSDAFVQCLIDNYHGDNKDAVITNMLNTFLSGSCLGGDDHSIIEMLINKGACECSCGRSMDDHLNDCEENMDTDE